MSKHLCESCNKSVRKGQPVCVCEVVKWNDEPHKQENPKSYSAGIIECLEYAPLHQYNTNQL
jgi:hypothetical protein